MLCGSWKYFLQALFILVSIAICMDFFFFANISMCNCLHALLRAWKARRGLRTSLGVNLQTVGNLEVGAWKWTQVLCKSSMCSSPWALSPVPQSKNSFKSCVEISFTPIIHRVHCNKMFPLLSIYLRKSKRYYCPCFWFLRLKVNPILVIKYTVENTVSKKAQN